MTRMFVNVVRGFSLVHDPEGSHYKKEGVPGNDKRDASLPALFICHCETLPLHFFRVRVTKGTSWRPFFIVIAGLFTCHCKSNIWQSREDQILNPKSEILNNVKEQSAVSKQ